MSRPRLRGVGLVLSRSHFSALDSAREMSGDEFDVSDLQPEDGQKVISKCGNLLVQFTYVVNGEKE